MIVDYKRVLMFQREKYFTHYTYLVKENWKQNINVSVTWFNFGRPACGLAQLRVALHGRHFGERVCEERSNLG